MATSNAERQRRHRARLADPGQLRASVLITLFEIAVGRRKVTPSQMRAIELWLLLDQQPVLNNTPGIGKKAMAEARSKLPPPDDSVWAVLLGDHDPDETSH